MADGPTITLPGGLRALDVNQVATDDIQDEALTTAKHAPGSVAGSVIADLGVVAGKLGLGSVSNFLNIAGSTIRPYHMNGAAITAATSRNIAASDLQARMVSCTGPITLTIPDGITTSGDGSWPTGHSTLIGCANSSTVTLAVSGSQSMTAANGTVLTGAGAIGLLTRVATNSWRFVILSGGARVPISALTTTGTPSSAAVLRGDGAWTVMPEVRVAVKAADQTKTNDATPAADTDLTLPVTANTVYAVDVVILGSAATTPDLKIGWSGPSGAQFLWSEDHGAASNNASVIGQTLIIAGNAGETTRHFYVNGTLTVAGTAGSFAVTWAQDTLDAGNATLKAGTWIRLTKLA